MSGIENVIKHLKNNKAPGSDGFTTEVLKLSGESLISLLHRIINNVWEQLQFQMNGNRE